MLSKNRSGFTLVEIIIVMGIIVILLMIGSVNFLPLKQKVSLTTTVQSMITDLKQQQLKSMAGNSVQGVYFDTNGYTIFQGSTYTAGNSTNFFVPYGDQIVLFSTNFSGSQIIFSAQSGEIAGFSPSANQIVLKNTFSNEQKIISFNKYGTIISVQ